MRKVRSGCLAALIAAALVGTAVSEEAPAVGKLAEQLAASDVNARRDAAARLGQLGPSARAALPALIKALDDPDKQVWLNSMNALAALGPDAADAIPRLIEALDGRKSGAQRGRDNKQLPLRAAYALSRIGAPAVPRLIESLGSEDASLRAGAARALGGMGVAAQEASDALVGNLGHADATVRTEAVDALSLIGAPAKAKLLAALDAKEPLVRASAALALGGIGKAAADAAPALLERLSREPDAAVRVSLLTAAARLGANPAQLSPLLIEALQSPDEQIQRAAVDGLITSRAVHAAAVPPLRSLLQTGDAALSARAARVLGGIGPQAKAAAPDLVAAFAKEQQPPYRQALVQLGDPGLEAVLTHTESLPPDALTREHWSVAALRSFGPLAVPRLTRALADPHLPTRLASALTLAELGAEARTAEPALLAALDDSDPRMRGHALAALGTVSASPKSLLPRVKAALEDPAPPVRAGALQLVRALGEPAKELMPKAIAALQDANENVRRAALDAIGPGAEGAVPVLTERLSEEAQRPAILDALIRLGAAAAPAVPRLVELFPQASKELRLKLFATFKKIGGGAQSALPSVTSALSDADAEIRAAAVSTVANIETDAGNKVRVLGAALDDPEPMVRVAAMTGLSAMGEAGAGAAPQLVKKLNSDKDRGFALDTLRKVQVRDVPSLIAMLNVSDGNVRVLACERLASLGEAARDALPVLQKLLTAGAGKRVEIETQKAIDKINAAPK